jgi:hypothetical protein
MDRLIEEPIEITLHADNINKEESKAWNPRTILLRHSKSQRLGGNSKKSNTGKSVLQTRKNN